MTIHRVASDGFGTDAHRYERGRPGYGPTTVDRVVELLSDASRIAEIGAGTGKLTRDLVDHVPNIVAVEPVDAMGELLAELVPEAYIVAGAAESLPLADESFDGAVIAQAFHWFDADAALEELRRVLRPDAAVVVVWNARDRSVEWVDGLWQIMDRVEKQAPWRDHDNDPAAGLTERPGFGELHHELFANEQEVDRPALLDRFASVSHIAVLPAERRAEILAEVEQFLDGHPATAGRDELRLPYRTDLYWFRRDAALSR